ncbi:MAG: prolipoprotein diacylglyceryl transferase [Chloroflexi bacterium]|nr:prolipoprotein diacylglyceryl transferase [Chloroflexota bacterium]
MFPQTLFSIAGYNVNFYILFYILGLAPAIILGLWLARARGIPLMIVLDVCVLGGIGAIGAALAFYVLTQSFLPTLPNVWGIPAIAGFLIAAIIYGARHPLRQANVLVPLDVAFAPLALYQAITRLGCFCAGCCHGKPVCGECQFPWAITFSDPSSASIYQGVPVYPTQLFLALGDVLIALALLALRNKPEFRGALIWVYLIGYGALRFFVEFTRGDVRAMIGDLYLSQVIGLALALIGALMLARRFVFGTRAQLEVSS